MSLSISQAGSRLFLFLCWRLTFQKWGLCPNISVDKARKKGTSSVSCCLCWHGLPHSGCHDCVSKAQRHRPYPEDCAGRPWESHLTASSLSDRMNRQHGAALCHLLLPMPALWFGRPMANTMCRTRWTSTKQRGKRKKAPVFEPMTNKMKSLEQAVNTIWMKEKGNYLEEGLQTSQTDLGRCWSRPARSNLPF